MNNEIFFINIKVFYINYVKDKLYLDFFWDMRYNSNVLICKGNCLLVFILIRIGIYVNLC